MLWCVSRWVIGPWSVDTVDCVLCIVFGSWISCVRCPSHESSDRRKDFAWPFSLVADCGDSVLAVVAWSGRGPG